VHVISILAPYRNSLNAIVPWVLRITPCKVVKNEEIVIMLVYYYQKLICYIN
jgi:hypothetical protein